MLLSAEITERGFYWYHEWIGGHPVLVEVRGWGTPWTVHFCRRRQHHRLEELKGLFEWTVAANDVRADRSG